MQVHTSIQYIKDNDHCTMIFNFLYQILTRPRILLMLWLRN